MSRTFWFLVIAVAAFWAINNPSKAPVLNKYLPEPGILPSSKLYPAKILYEDIRALLTFDNLSKVKLYLELADKRLAEIKKLEEKGDVSRAKETLARYQSHIDQSQKTIEKTREKTKEFQESADKIIGEAKSKNAGTLAELYAKTSGEIKDAISDSLNKIINWQNELAK